MLTNNKSRLKRNDQKVKSSYERKDNRVTTVHLVKSPLPNTSIYRFEWIPGQPDRPADCRIRTHSRKCPPFGCTFNSNSSSSVNSLKVYDDEKKLKNSPTKLIAHSETIDNLLENNKFYTSVNVQFHKSSQKNKPNISVEYKRVNALDPFRNKNNIKKTDCRDIREKGKRKVEKTEDSDVCSSVTNNEEFSTSVQYAKLVDGHLTTDRVEMDNNNEKESSNVGNDTDYDSDDPTCENDDQFEIAVLNNQLQLEMKKITI